MQRCLPTARSFCGSKSKVAWTQAFEAHPNDHVAFCQANVDYNGTTVGRVANRIAQGKFSLEGKNYSLEANNGVGGFPFSRSSVLLLGHVLSVFTFFFSAP